MENINQLDMIFAALADSRRRAMLELLAREPKGVGELASAAGLKMSAASKHIAQLQEAGLLLKGKRGRDVICHMNYDAWKDVAGYVAMHAQFWAGRLDELDHYLREVKE